jgi:carbon starvation protein CstA
VGRSDGTPQDRRVVVLIGLLVAAVLLVSLVSALLPEIDGALASAPIVVIALVVGTVLLMARALRG